MPGIHFGHLNRGYLRAPFGSPEVAGFEDNLARVNDVAARSAGFVMNVGVDPAEVRAAFLWPEADLERVAATLSVWTDAHLLADFVHKTIHGRFLSRRAEWFVPLEGPAYVVWPIPAGHVPGVAEARVAHERLAANGPGPDAFDFTWLRAGGRSGG